MAVIATIALKDSADVAKNYLPERVQTGAYASWVNRDQGTFAGTKRASLTKKTSTAKLPMEKTLLKITQPSIDVVTGDVKYTNYFLGEVGVHQKATLAERQELVNSVAALCGLAPIKLASTTGEAISG